MTDFTIDVIKSDGVISVCFKQAWQQEDCSALAQQLMAKFNNITCIDTLIGADRETYRLKWQDNIWLLHFEFYSQSCWFESELPISDQSFADFAKQLTQAI